MPIDLRDLVKNPETTPFSRLKYLVRQSDEDVTRFMNELFNLSALARNRAEKPWLGRGISAVKPRRTESWTIVVRAGPRRKWP